MNKENNQLSVDIPIEDSAVPLKDSFLELDFIVSHKAAAHSRYVDGDYIRLVSLGLLALNNKCRLTSSSGKEKKEIDNAHVICLMHKLTSSNRDSDDLSIGFYRSNETREKELNNNKKLKVIIMLEFI